MPRRPTKTWKRKEFDVAKKFRPIFPLACRNPLSGARNVDDQGKKRPGDLLQTGLLIVEIKHRQKVFDFLDGQFLIAKIGKSEPFKTELFDVYDEPEYVGHELDEFVSFIKNGYKGVFAHPSKQIQTPTPIRKFFEENRRMTPHGRIPCLVVHPPGSAHYYIFFENEDWLNIRTDAVDIRGQPNVVP